MAFERAVAKVIANHLTEQAARHAILAATDLADSVSASDEATTFAARIKISGAALVSQLILYGKIARGEIRVSLDATLLAEALSLPPKSLSTDLLEITAPFTCRRRGVEMKIIAGETDSSPDLAMIRALRNAHLWAADLRKGTSLSRIADTRGVSKSYVARVLPLACLSPKIQAMILEGSQPIAMNLEALVRSRLPLDWNDQERMLGFSA